MKRLSVSVTGKDRPGIIAAVTEIIYQFHGNLEDASMTVLAGEFAMILLASFPPTCALPALQKRFTELERRKRLSILTQPVHARRRGSRGKTAAVIPYLISIFGPDRSGIVYQISRALARHRLNITDLDSKLMSSKRRPIYGLLIETDIPNRFPIPRLKQELAQIARRLHVEFTLKPVEPLTL